MRVLICGGRNYADHAFFERVMNNLVSVLGPKLENLVVIHGGAAGADSMAARWAEMNGCAAEEYLADWSLHGRSAGYIRNSQMLKEGNPDLVIAFPGGNGTKNMVSISRKAGVPVKEFVQ